MVKRLRTNPIFLGLLLALVSVIPGISQADSIVTDAAATRLQVTDPKHNGPRPKLVLYTTMATWCGPCKAELPQFVYLRSVFKPEELEMFGLPYDDGEGAERLKAWAVANHPAYALLASLSKENIASVKMIALKTLQIEGLPTTIVTDANGRILRTRWGPPSVSELRELLRSQRDSR